MHQIYALDSHKAIACTGEHADRTNFAEYVQKNVTLQEFRTGIRNTTHATANYIRGELAYFLRRSPYNVNMLIGGVDMKKPEDAGPDAEGVPTPSLYYLEYLGSMQKANFGCHGYGAYFIYSTLDRYWKPGLTQAEAREIAMKCIKQVNLRFLVGMPSWSIKIITRDGIEEETMAAPAADETA